MKKRVPLTPLGPSEVLIAGIPSRGTAAVCQKSVPETRAIFSLVLSWERSSSISKSLSKVGAMVVVLFAAVEPLELRLYGYIDRDEDSKKEKRAQLNQVLVYQNKKLENRVLQAVLNISSRYRGVPHLRGMVSVNSTTIPTPPDANPILRAPWSRRPPISMAKYRHVLPARRVMQLQPCSRP